MEQLSIHKEELAKLREDFENAKSTPIFETYIE
jgi:hypothetical protein